MSQSRRTGNINIFGLGVYALVFFMVVPVAAQQHRPTVPRIGFLLIGFKPPKEFFDAMGRLGYVDGQNITYEYRNGEGGEKRLLEQAANLVQQKLKVLIVAGAAAGLAAKKSTQTIPIVYLGGGDPVALGLVESLSHPGGNLTGVTELSPELTAKRLELLKETFPKISIVSVLVRVGAPEITNQLEGLERQATALKLKLQIIETRDSKDIESSLATAIPQDAGALIELPNPLFHANIARIVNFASKHKLPTIFHSKDFVEAGGLMAYGADFTDLYRRAATYVDKILKGAIPAGLPVEQPTKFEMVINLKTAKQIGLTIPPNVLARADRVIK
jgi:putative ABC transport system substrate-binding protein